MKNNAIKKTKQKQKEVAIVMGSDSDWPIMRVAARTLTGFDVAHEVDVISAHRSPRQAAAFAESAARRGLKVIIACAGSAAHLAGILAAHTTLPVIGVPIKGGVMDGMDALLSTVQMPAGVPVATVALGSAGPVNAALLSVQILALSNPKLSSALRQHKRRLEAKVTAANRRIQSEMEQA